MRRTWIAGLAALLASCGTSADPGGEVVVSAAASLADAFEEMAFSFEEAHSGVDVVLNLGASSALRDQILEGAPADVFASADTKTMDAVVAGGAAAGTPAVFARNRLAIAVPAGNPASVSGLGGFADESLLIGVCAEDVPCGRLGREALASAGVTPSVDTEEPDVRALLVKVAAGELDAGLVYITDVAAVSGVEGITIPDADNVVTDYPIAVLAEAPDPDAATAFVDFVLSDDGRSILASYGFGLP